MGFILDVPRTVVSTLERTAVRYKLGGVHTRYETYLIPGETLIPGKGGKRFTLVLDIPPYLLHTEHFQGRHTTAGKRRTNGF